MVVYREGLRAVKGEGEFILDLPDPPGTLYMGIYRSPVAHGIIKGIDLEGVKSNGGIAYGPEQLLKVIKNPFPLAVEARINYYPFALRKVRFVGEPIAVVLANDYYKALDLIERVQVDIDEIDPVDTIDEALKGDILVHEELKRNVVMYRKMKFGEVENAFNSSIIVESDFNFSRNAVFPLETYSALVRAEEDSLNIWSNVQGPMLQVYFISRAFNVPVNRVRLYSPRDIGGSFGSKYSLYPYITLALASSMLSGKPVRWIESRTESFIASSSGAERKGRVEIASDREGKIKGVKFHFLEDVGAYPRPPEPGALFRVQGNLNGAYDIRAIEGEYYVVLTNKSPSSLNRGYGGPPFYFALETAIDKLAEELKIDPLDIRIRNLIKDFPLRIGNYHFYETITGGLYPKQDYLRVVKAIEGEYRKYLEEKRRDGKRMGIGVSVLVEPSGTNLAYVDLALEPLKRRNPHSASSEYVNITLNPDGSVSVFINGTNEGLGHETTIAEIISRELGIEESEVTVINKVDTTMPWNLASGSYSSRFAPIVISCVLRAVGELKERLGELARKYLETESVFFKDGKFFDSKNPGKSIDLRKLTSMFYWDPASFGDVKGLSVSSYFFPSTLSPPQGDKINSSFGYSIQAHLAIVEQDEVTGEIKVKKYIVSHDSGKILNKDLVENQMLGSLLQGIAITFYEELKYSKGTPLVTLFDTYETPSLAEINFSVQILHFETELDYLPSKALGIGEGPIMGVPSAIANAVSNLLGKRISRIPIKPWGI